jgi:hypothetical protein
LALIPDTGPLYALLDRGDSDHDACRDLLQTLRERRIIPAPVLVEVEQLTAGRRLPSAFLALMNDVLVGAFHIEDLVRDDYMRIRELLMRYADANIGFVDAAVLAVVERLGEPKLATLDRRHFGNMRPRQVASLQLLPESVP